MTLTIHEHIEESMDSQQAVQQSFGASQYGPVLSGKLQPGFHVTRSSPESTLQPPYPRLLAAKHCVKSLHEFLHITRSYAPIRREAYRPSSLLQDIPIHVAALTRADLLRRVLSDWTYANTSSLAKDQSETRLRLVEPILDAFGTLLVPSALEDGIKAMNGLGYGNEIEIGRSIRDDLVQRLNGSQASPVLAALYDRRTVDCYIQWAMRVIESASRGSQIRGLEVARLVDEFQALLVSIHSHLVLLERALQGEGDWGVFGWWMKEKDGFHCDVMDKLRNDQMWTSKAKL
ncbi:acyl- dehydrogenase domain-containing protein [Moniliophthora roreri MCA 2997]|uniref:Acyl-dehydrogenase domain-containing protein n=1 Tax=Moniliophthora roreri (strain MCA 2997) TaxID=1381753 RepID=V2WY74_MONRO|nr:acyl- dehydrogenase domain-containing protein [Moniliophthora roreri MCA 2997]